MNGKREVFISVDVETAGPIPGIYSLLSIGACVIENPAQTYACELKPTTTHAEPAALEVTGLSLERLACEGLAPEVAMREFRTWVLGVCESKGEPVFVGFNAAFDWSFINYYFHRYLGDNPFGFSALDIKSLYMGAVQCAWHDTRSSQMAKSLQPHLAGNHDALQDALYQAELFRCVRALTPARPV
ncbi:3'-5' exonuclease [Xanthomonas citri]|uniref:3'-5' exonuclease n=1 Tax=Xanthomonas citri TaxID=346 RepID=UPI000C06D748|nr:3'-5' exonuclease [Xanthomonas citri]